MPRKISNEDLSRMVESLEEELRAFHDFDKKLEETIEAKLYEVKAVAYITLLLVAVMLAIAFGIVLRALGF